MSIAGEVISLRQELYKLEMSREEGIISYFIKISEIQDQLQELGEELSTVVLNALQRDGKTSLQASMGRKKQHHFKIYGLYVR